MTTDLRKKAMNEIDKLQRKLDYIRQEFEASAAQQRAGHTFKRIVGRLPGKCGIKHDTTGFCFLCNQMVGPSAVPVVAEEEQIGGS